MDLRVYDTRISLSALISLKAYARALDFRAFTKSRALLAGQRFSSFRGRGMEFDETRVYQAGDDIRSMDWRVTARTGRAHTKLYCEDRERPVYFLVDLTASMHFGSRVTFKSVIAEQAAALLAWAAAFAGDSVGGWVMGSGTVKKIQPHLGARSVLTLLRSMQEIANEPHLPNSQEGMDVLRTLLKDLKPGSLLFILTDAYQFTSESLAVLSRLSQTQDCVLGFIYDELEKNLPKKGLYSVTDNNQICQFDSGNKRFRTHYQEDFFHKKEALKSFCMAHHIGFFQLSTSVDVVYELRKIFNKSVHSNQSTNA